MKIKRNKAIQLAYTREINLSTKVVKSKRVYSRKTKINFN